MTRRTPPPPPGLRRARGVAACALATLLAACGAARAVPARPGVPQITLEDDTDAPLATGDVVRLDAPTAPWLTGVYRVAADGTVTLPRVGPVLARGRPLAALVRVFDAFPDVPRLTLGVHTRVAGRIAVGGEVRHPGLFAPRGAITLADALLAAGGTTARADEERIVVERVHDTGQIERLVLPLAPAGRVFTLVPGDAIVVPTEGATAR